MGELEIIISEAGKTVYVHDSKTKECLASFSRCDYDSLQDAVEAAREFIKNRKL